MSFKKISNGRGAPQRSAVPNAGYSPTKCAVRQLAAGGCGTSVGNARGVAHRELLQERAANQSVRLGCFADVPSETVVHILCFLDCASLAATQRSAKAWSWSDSSSSQSLVDSASHWHLRSRLQLPQVTTSGRSGPTAVHLAEAAVAALSPDLLSVLRGFGFGLCPCFIGVFNACWDRIYRSPENVLQANDVIQKRPSDARLPWHAAFLKTDLELSLRYAFRVDILVERAGDGIIEIGIATRNDTAKLAALHWPGLRDTQAFTYANSGQRFFNFEGVDEDTWCRDFGRAYGQGDVISCEVSVGTLRFFCNNEVVGDVNLDIRVLTGPIFIGTTLTDGARLRLLSKRVAVLGLPSAHVH